MGIRLGLFKSVTLPTYDAMVYQTSSHTIAVDKNGKTLESTQIASENDDVVIQAALDYMDTLCVSVNAGQSSLLQYTNGFKLFINSGLYWLSAPIYIRYPHNICGSGSGYTHLTASHLSWANATGAMIYLNKDENYFGSISYITLEGMRLNGEGYAEYGVVFTNLDSVNACSVGTTTSNTHFVDLMVTAFKRWGIVDNSRFGSTYTNCVFRDNNSPALTTQPTYSAEVGTDATHIHCPNAALPSATNDMYNGWYLWNITRGIGAPITDFVESGHVITVAIAGQANGDTFNIFPPYGNILIDGVSKPTFTGCVFDSSNNGIVIRRGDGASFYGCHMSANDVHGVYIYSYGTSHPTDMHFTGTHSQYNGQYNSTYTPVPSVAIHDFYISDADCWYCTISDTHTIEQTGITESLRTLGDYTTILNYHCSTGAIGTLGGIGSLNINSAVAAGGATTGTATVLAGNTSVTVTHGHVGVPTTVQITPLAPVSGRDYWADTIGAATFNLNISSADAVDHAFSWEAG